MKTVYMPERGVVVPDFSEEVARGIEFLERQNPEWWALVRPELLDVSCADHCVLGQVGHAVFGLDREEEGYWQVLRHISEDPDLVPQSAFDAALEVATRRRLAVIWQHDSEWTTLVAAAMGFNLDEGYNLAMVDACVEAGLDDQADEWRKGDLHDYLWSVLGDTWVLFARADRFEAQMLVGPLERV